MPRCAGCTKEIEGQYVQALGRDWHPECFTCDICGIELQGGFHEHEGRKLCPSCYAERFAPRCAKCGKPITGQYATALGRTWHPDCLRCTGCNKLLEGESFHENDGKPYCTACFAERFRPRCTVCGGLLKNRYNEDPWGNAYCPSHEKRPGLCDYCGRVMCEALTGGGTTFADGRKVCTSCQQTAVESLAIAQGMADLVNAFFAKRGYPLQADLPISLVQPGDLPKDTRGQRQLGLIIKKIRTQNGKEHSRSVERIKLLTGMPAEKFCEVYAHEYGHAWMLHAGYPKLPLLAEEGIAQIFSHLWLSERGTIFSSVLKSMVERNTDEIYGTGLRQALTGLRTLGLTGLLAYVKTNRQLPTTD